MFGLSRSTEYAVMALARLAASQREAGAEPGVAISARRLADADGSPAALLSGVLKRLHQAGLIASKRGARGGYYLDRPPERIRLIEVIAAIEGPEPVRLTPCCERDEPSHHHDHHAPRARAERNRDTHEKQEEGCPIVCHCPITGAVRSLNQRMQGFLRQLTLAELIEA